MLTQKQENFVNDLFAGVPQGQAYKKNYNTQNMLQTTIDRNAHELAGTNKIATRLEEMRQSAKTPLIADYQERQEILTEIVRGKVVEFIDKKGKITLDAPNNRALQEVTVLELKGGSDETVIAETKKVKLHSPTTAIDLLNKMDKVYSDAPTFQDNRVVNIIVSSEKAKELTEGVEGFGIFNKRKELPEGE